MAHGSTNATLPTCAFMRPNIATATTKVVEESESFSCFELDDVFVAPGDDLMSSSGDIDEFDE